MNQRLIDARCFDCKSTKNLRAIHNTLDFALWRNLLFRLQKYKKFESNSQRILAASFISSVVSTAKVQKIWEQFTTSILKKGYAAKLFRLQKYKKFESNSQREKRQWRSSACCFDCKSTKNLRAIHNYFRLAASLCWVVSTAKVQKIWEQFTTTRYHQWW